MPRPASTALQTFLASRQPWWSADLFTIVLQTGLTLYITSADRDISYSGTTWNAPSSITHNASFAVTRKSWSVKNTMDVPEMEIELISTGTDFTTGDGPANIKLLLHNGLFDGAYVTMFRAFMPVIGGNFANTSLGIVPIFAGPVGQIEITGIGAKIKVKGANIRHQQYMPRNRFLSNCVHALYDAGCTVVKASYTFSGTVASASSTGISWTSDPTSGNYGNLVNGYCTMTSGVAEGTVRTVGGSSSSGISFLYAMYETPAAGDTFTVVYGCDKTTSTCTNRFSNIQNYMGFPFTPPADLAL